MHNQVHAFIVSALVRYTKGKQEGDIILKKLILIILISVGLVGGIMLIKSGKTSAPANPTSHTYGSGSSGVKLVEYADFQCPGCGAFFPILQQVKAKYKDQISFQFVNFPLSQIHPNAQSAHRAAQAASNQDKFWEMHDLLFQNQNSWKDSPNVAIVFDGYATQLGLDLAKFKKDFASSATNSIIQADIKTGQILKVTGTPTFFLDGKQISDNNTVASLEKFSAVIDNAILAKTGKPATTTTNIIPATIAPSTNGQ